MASTQAAGKTRIAGGSKTKSDLPSSVVDDSQPDLQGAKEGPLNTSKLPGLKTTKTTMSHGHVSSEGIGMKGHGQSLAKKVTEPHVTGSSQDASVFVPSSLTPSSQRRGRGSGDNGGNSQLPNSGLLLELFQSSKRKKKRGASVLDDNDDDDDDVVCIDDEERGKGREEGSGREKPAAKVTQLTKQKTLMMLKLVMQRKLKSAMQLLHICLMGISVMLRLRLLKCLRPNLS